MAADFAGQRVDLAKEPDFRLGTIQVRPSTRQIETGGTADTLEPRIMQVLVALARKRGQVVSRDELIETCWEGRIVGGDALNRCISKIRKLGEVRGYFRIEAIARVGYRLWVEETGPEAATPTDAGDSVQLGSASPPSAVGNAIARLRRIPATAWATIAAVAILGAIAWWWIDLNGRVVDVTSPSQRVAFFGFKAADDNPASARIAADATDRTFAEFTRMRIDATARAGPVNVSATDRLARATALGAAYVLSGEIRTEGEEARIVIRLEDPATGTSLGESTETTPVARPFYSPAARAAFSAAANLECIVALRAELSRETPASLRAIASVCFNIDDPEIAQTAARSLAEFEPDSIFFRAFLASQLTALSTRLPADLRAERLQEADALTKEALRMAPGDPFSVAVAVLVRTARGESPLEAERLLETAKSDGSPWAQSWLLYVRGLELLGNGRTAEAVGRLKAAEAAMPSLAGASSLRAYGLGSLGQSADAEVSFEQAFARAPDHPLLWRQWVKTAVLDGVGDPVAVIAAAPESEQRARVACWISVLAARRAGPVGVSVESLRDCAPTYSANISIAAAFGHVDEAFDRYRALPLPLAPDSRMTLFTPSARPMRADAKFPALAKELGLWDYWIETGSHPDICDLPTEKGFPICTELRKTQTK